MNCLCALHKGRQHRQLGCYNELHLHCTHAEAQFRRGFCAHVILLDKVVIICAVASTCAQHFFQRQRPSTETIMQRLSTGFAIQAVVAYLQLFWLYTYI